jgi:hypothetical protein
MQEAIGEFNWGLQFFPSADLNEMFSPSNPSRPFRDIQLKRVFGERFKVPD